MTARIRDNVIGREIFERIKDFSRDDKAEYIKNLSAENKDFYRRYYNSYRQQKYKQDEAKKAIANDRAKEGMKKMRDIRTPEEVKQYLQLRKNYDKKYEVKRKMTKQEASTIIQRQYRKNKEEQKKKQEVQTIAKDILTDIIGDVFNKKIVNGELKKKRGRKLGQVAKK